MENLQTNDEVIIKKWLKFIKPIWIVSFLLAVCLIFIGYEFGFKKLMDNSYLKGFLAGQIQVNQTVITQFCQFSRIGINVPLYCNPNATTFVQVILAPEIQNNSATTTQ